MELFCEDTEQSKAVKQFNWVNQVGLVKLAKLG